MLRLDQYLEERNQLLQDITHLLDQDPHVNAAWLFGSLGRGDGDALSDIDLWVVVEDDQIEKIIQGPHEYASQVSQPVLVLEAPQNAPEGGAYLMACYDRVTAPHIIDWYWQPQSLAYIPGQVRLLFDRAGLSHKDQPIKFPGVPARKEIVERPIHFISFFWMMLMITAKHAARSSRAEKMELLPMLVDPITKVQRLLGRENILSLDQLPPQRQPQEKILLLYKLADQMSELMALFSMRGEQVPHQVVPGAYRYLDLISNLVESS